MSQWCHLILYIFSSMYISRCPACLSLSAYWAVYSSILWPPCICTHRWWATHCVLSTNRGGIPDQTSSSYPPSLTPTPCLSSPASPVSTNCPLMTWWSYRRSCGKSVADWGWSCSKSIVWWCSREKRWTDCGFRFCYSVITSLCDCRSRLCEFDFLWDNILSLFQITIYTLQ